MPGRNWFERDAADYATFRPEYPDALFVFLTSAAPSTLLAWDVGTGTGQAARGLAPFFQHVIATDSSSDQVRAADPAPGVEFRVAAAEDSGLDDHSVALVTVAQALHWFDLPRFYTECRRVLVPGGLVCAFCYGLLEIDAATDAIISGFYRDEVGPFWPPERRHVENGYQDLEFPFTPVEVPRFVVEADWDFDELMGYLGTWSACRNYRETRGIDPRTRIAEPLADAWGDPATRRHIRWPLHFRCGRLAPVDQAP